MSRDLQIVEHLRVQGDFMLSVAEDRALVSRRMAIYWEQTAQLEEQAAERRQGRKPSGTMVAVPHPEKER